MVAASIVLPIKDRFQLRQVWLQLSNESFHNRQHRAAVLVTGLESVYKCHHLQIFVLCPTSNYSTVPGHASLANQSLWLSLNFLGRNFMAQSCTRSTELSSRAIITSSGASSWLTHRSRCAFHAKMFCLAWPSIKANSSQERRVHQSKQTRATHNDRRFLDDHVTGHLIILFLWITQGVCSAMVWNAGLLRNLHLHRQYQVAINNHLLFT